MADIRAFRGFRYDLGRVGALSDVVAPPYDVVDPALQQTLYDASPHNAIRLELTKDEPGDTEAVSHAETRPGLSPFGRHTARFCSGAGETDWTRNGEPPPEPSRGRTADRLPGD